MSRRKGRLGQPAGDAGAREGDALELTGRAGLRDLERAIRGGWEINPERKARYMAALDRLIATYDGPDHAQVIVACNRVLQMEQASALKDLHQREHDARIDAGKATERVATEPTVLVHTAPPDAPCQS